MKPGMIVITPSGRRAVVQGNDKNTPPGCVSVRVNGALHHFPHQYLKLDNPAPGDYVEYEGRLATVTEILPDEITARIRFTGGNAQLTMPFLKLIKIDDAYIYGHGEGEFLPAIQVIAQPGNYKKARGCLADDWSYDKPDKGNGKGLSGVVDHPDDITVLASQLASAQQRADEAETILVNHTKTHAQTLAILSEKSLELISRDEEIAALKKELAELRKDTGGSNGSSPAGMQVKSLTDPTDEEIADMLSDGWERFDSYLERQWNYVLILSRRRQPATSNGRRSAAAQTVVVTPVVEMPAAPGRGVRMPDAIIDPVQVAQQEIEKNRFYQAFQRGLTVEQVIAESDARVAAAGQQAYEQALAEATRCFQKVRPLRPTQYSIPGDLS